MPSRGANRPSAPLAWWTPPKLAKWLRIDPSTILNWIRSGELAAVNLAVRRGGRPRYKISHAEVQTFLKGRSTVPPPKPTRQVRQKKQPPERDYFST